MRKRLTASSLRGMLDKGEISPREAVMLCQGTESEMFSVPLTRRALARAIYAAERIAERSARDTTGVPIAVEDTLCVAGIDNFNEFYGREAPTYDATILHKLDGYGALIVGMLAGSPFGLGVQSFAAGHAVLSKVCLAALALNVLPCTPHTMFQEDIAALKPSFGTVSRYGVAMAAPSLKQVGIAASTTKDVAMMMDAISDFDPYDPAMLRPNCYNYARLFGQSVKGMKIGAIEDANFAPFKMLGFVQVPATMPEAIAETHAAIEAVEALFTLAGYEPDDCYPTVKNALCLGKRMLNEGAYPGALASRARITSELCSMLETCDALLLPTDDGAPIAAMAAELSGLPCASIGNIALIGHMGGEAALLQIINALEGGTV